MKSLKDCYTLANGVKIPCMAIGTWRSENDEAKNSVIDALNIGYRHVDTAAIYGNEKSIGDALKESSVPREEIFVTSKLWNTEQGYESTLKAFDKTMDDLKLQYLDLYLIHWPAVFIHKNTWQKDNLETWRAFEKLYKDERIRAIGVSNFLPHHLKPLLEKIEIKPMVNQIEFHLSYMQNEAVEFSKKHGMVVESWAPLGRGDIFKLDEMKELSKKYNKTIAQVCLRWCLQHETLPLPKSVHAERIKENSEIFDFEISKSDMKIMDNITTCGNVNQHPDTIDF